MGGGTPDPYVKLSINNRETLGKTHYKKSTSVLIYCTLIISSSLIFVPSRSNPSWDETLLILVCSLQESLVLNLFDYNDHRPDTELGSVNFELAKLLDDSKQEGINDIVLKDGKDRGTLRYDIAYYPVLKPTMVDGKEELPETSMLSYIFCHYFELFNGDILFRCWYCAFNDPSSQGTRCLQVNVWRTQSAV